MHKKVEALLSPERLDIYLSRELQLTRAKIKTLYEGGHILVNGKKPDKLGVKVRGGETLEIEIPTESETTLKAEAIPLDIIYEDDALLVLNKPPGLVVHPAAGHWEGTLVNALLYHFKTLSGVDPKRPGIVHRLDKDTSGLLLIAKTDEAHLAMSRQLHDREMEKYYQVLVYGKVTPVQGVIDKPIGRHPKNRKKMGVVLTGRHALTRYTVLKQCKGYALLECKIETGRTHQIRVHLASIGHPVVGDALYGKEDASLGVARQLLHAWKVILEHPLTHDKMTFVAPLPRDFQTTLNDLFINC